MPTQDLAGRATAVRRFNRFYTRHIGVLGEGLLGSRFSLTEARVLFELAHAGETTASELCSELNLNAGYLSRILGAMETDGLVQRCRSRKDGRRRLLSLSHEGEQAFAMLNARSRNEVEAMLARMPGSSQAQLLSAMETITALLAAPTAAAGPKSKPAYILRPHQPGDMGWVTHRHGVLYYQEYGWDETFEALVARITADFIQNLDPQRERCWIAEVDGEIVGSVFVVQHDEQTAQLRLLFVEPQARGLGLGARLVDECIGFSRLVGYQRLRLWTQSELHAARRIYERASFRLVLEEPHHSFGHDLVAQTWELDL
ncbi:MAG: bifunctional helix-turn-helix transcriptional regulator/GNAT family N-acetyltransferase [Planctomycetota bacterium]|jgi:DNA-binding MarR family transcriptional regulator/GNAT superfamily N-acetyltransferase